MGELVRSGIKNTVVRAKGPSLLRHDVDLLAFGSMTSSAIKRSRTNYMSSQKITHALPGEKSMHRPSFDAASRVNPTLTEGGSGSSGTAAARLPVTVRTAAAHASAAESARRLSRETVGQLTGAGLARHFVPRRWGGEEGTFGGLLATAATVGEGCASAGWCGALFAAHGRFAAYLPARGQDDLWGRTPDVLIATAIRPAGEARPAPDGWTLSGEWHCVSGVDHADWALLSARGAEERDAGPRLYAVPRADFAVLESWRSLGLRGTGSHTVVVTGAQVPRHRAFPVAELMAGAPGFGRQKCHTVPSQLVGGLIFCAPALGAARNALDTWSRWAKHAAQRSHSQGADRSLHRTLARSTTDLDAARLLLEDAARRVDTGNWTEQDVARNSYVATTAIDLLVKSVDRLFRTGGVHIHENSDVLERCWRDINTIADHAVLRSEPAALIYADSIFSGLRDSSPAQLHSAPGISASETSRVPA
ncbi:acyl-CoA dehydrogenase family protein [Streptomyces sp. NPDC088725]|uniref:acyl-CoA dehydrogenase family protein n=1 Tax=Streptomyces sp. NPDC088725 TaxID=3365873 RepID=UPI00382195B9